MPNKQIVGEPRVAKVNAAFTRCRLGTKGAAGVPPRDMPWAPAMAQSRPPRSAGCLFAVLPLAGAIAGGLAAREPVIGLLAGTALALILVTLFWLVDRRE